MKVLEVFGEPVSNGGQESFVFNVLQHMDLTDLQIDVLTPYYCDNEYYRKMLENLGGCLYSLGLPFAPGKSRGNIYQPLISFLNEHSYDTVHIHSGSISILALASLAAKKGGIPKIIVHSHATGDRRNLKYRITKTVMTPLLDHCPTAYCACSTEAGEWKFSSKAMEKLLVLKNGVDLEKFAYSENTRQTMRKQLGIEKNTFVIGHVGRFSVQKNQRYIIELLKEIKSMIPDIKAMLIGTGATVEHIRSMVEEYGLKENVLFIGSVNNVQDYYQVMDVFLFPSTFEGFGIVGVEAQANGLTVLASTNVPEALRLSPLVRFISLEDTKRWTEETIKAKEIKRTDVCEQIRAAGFDINDTAGTIRQLYFGKS